MSYITYINSMNKQLLSNYALQGLSQRDISKLENCSQTKVSRYFRKYGLISSKKKPKRVCLACGKLLERKQTKYCSNKCQGTKAHDDFIKDLTTGKKQFNINNNGQIRKYILATRPHICAICNNTLWNSTVIPLIVDHIDGNYTNISPDNLRLVCPNCDAQLPTFKGKNKGKGRFKRRERYMNDQSY